MRERSLLIALLVFASVLTLAQSSEPRFPRNTVEFDELFQRVSNWGRWGADDQIGSLNLVTPEKRKQALSLPRMSVTVSLAHTPLTGSAEDNPSPFARRWNTLNAQPPLEWLMDTYEVSYHGVAHSHIDALCHVIYKDRSYNGYSRNDVRRDNGCGTLGIENLKDGIITRGILVDLPRLMGVPYLAPGVPVYAEDFEAWEKMTGVRISTGDAVLVRTGRWTRRAKVGPWNVLGNEAGVHASLAPWVKARGVALLGSDAGLDVFPSRVEGVSAPVHILMINALGINLLDNQDLDALAKTAAKLKRWEFMLTVAPVPVAGGTGSPVNALATF